MRFENRPPAEGINATPEHLGREAAWLIVGGLAAMVLVVVLADLGARWLAPHLPFSAELALAERMEADAKPLPPPERAANAALQQLADRLRGPLGLPDGLSVQVRVDSSEEVNAYATVGGRIVIHRGLLRRLQREDELAALLAHEMSHVRHRHVAASLGRALAVGVVLSAVSADVGGQAAQVILNQGGGLLMLGYSRDHEREADRDAVQAAAALHGHVGGVLGLFEQMGRTLACDERQPARTGRAQPPNWLSTHPSDRDRTEAARQWAHDAGVPLQGDAPALSPALLAFVAQGKSACRPDPA